VLGAIFSLFSGIIIIYATLFFTVYGFSETVLVMQGDGSLGAYECGVYKTLSKHKIKFDIVAGTSIGAVNAAIIVGSKNNDPAKDLEDFWLDVSEKVTPPFLPDNTRSIVSSFYAALYGNSKAFLPIWPKLSLLIQTALSL
jgi:NTE family protein